MLLQKIFLQINEKYSITNDEIEDLFTDEKNSNDIQIYKIILDRYESVLHNKFETIYRAAKEIKNKLLNLIKIYNWNRAVNSNIEQDLFLNKISDFDDKFVITILENSTIYKFRISDIVNLWVLALQNCEQLFVKPIELKNPYTNINFSKCALYNIYIKLLDTGFIVPNVITSHIKHELDINMFCIRNYPQLKENAILLFMREANYLDKYEQVINMLHDFRKEVDYHTMASLCSLTIKKESVTLFSNHLFLYLESKYSCNPLIKDESGTRVKEKLKKLIQEKPYFGFSRIDVIRYIPVSERSEVRRRERERERRRRMASRPILPPPPPPPLVLSNTDISNSPPPIPNHLRRRRRNAIAGAPPGLPLPTLPPPPPPPTENSIVRNYNPPDSDTPLPPININNYVTRTNDILTRTLTNDNTRLLSNVIFNINSDENIEDLELGETSTQNNVINNTVNNNVSIESTNVPSYLQNLLSSRDRTRDLLAQIDEVLETENDIENDIYNSISVDIENPFTPSRELNRTPPPPETDGSSNSILEPLIPIINRVNTREILERLNMVINNEIEGTHNETNTEESTSVETLVEEINENNDTDIETPNNDNSDNEWDF